jgi:hypothetical protein
VLLTGLTGVSHLWDLPRVNCLTRVSLGLGAVGQFFICLELFPLRVLVCFGSEGYVLVPRSSGTPVATWAWQIWVMSQRSVLEAVFVL